jgi:hypothetical protein
LFSSSSRGSSPEEFRGNKPEEGKLDIEETPMNKEEALAAVSLDLGIQPDWLRSLIDFESGWNPKAKNPYSSAEGLIQFVDSTAQSLGFKSAHDLVVKYPDVVSQLLNPVRQYLRQFKPFPTKQSLYMSVFYPAARNWTLDTVFPDSVRKVNPNINTVGDYVAFVERRNPLKKAAMPLLIIGVIIAGYFIYQHYQKGGSLWQTDEQTEAPQIELM